MLKQGFRNYVENETTISPFLPPNKLHKFIHPLRPIRIPEVTKIGQHIVQNNAVVLAVDAVAAGDFVGVVCVGG